MGLTIDVPVPLRPYLQRTNEKADQIDLLMSSLDACRILLLPFLDRIFDFAKTKYVLWSPFPQFLLPAFY